MKQNIEKKLLYEKIINLPFLQAFSKKKNISTQNQKTVLNFELSTKCIEVSFFQQNLVPEMRYDDYITR